MNGAEWDLVVVGGGCAGLSLASRLAMGPLRTLVLEPRSSYQEDRTWSFWAEGHPLASHSWSTVAVADGDRTVEARCHGRRYVTVRSSDFYADALRRIQTGGLVELRLGTVAGDIQPAPGGWSIATDTGPVLARNVVDTRPVRTTNPRLWQSFVGLEVETSASTFDPGIATLMEFVEAGPDEIAFLYKLPTSPTRALLEYTVFSARPSDPAELEVRLRNELPRLCGGRFYVLRREAGAIPMGSPAGASEVGPGHVRLPGLVRPSTGYAFQRIQRWADRCAAALHEGCGPVGPEPDGRLTRFMDDMFLRVLRRCPDLAPSLFLGLFKKVPTARLVRFLTEGATVADAAFMIAALPKGPFLRELLASPSVETSREGSARRVPC